MSGYIGKRERKRRQGDRYAPSDRCTGTYGIWTCDIRSGDAGVFSDKNRQIYPCCQKRASGDGYMH